MPPKKRTRAAQQPVKQEPEDGHDEGLERANETFPDGQPRGGATAGPTLRPRVRKAALSEGGKQSSSKDKKSTAKGKNAGTKGKKMASRGVTGKTTKKVGASTADGRTDDEENEEAKVENIPPSKRRRNAEPIEDTDQVVLAPQSTAPPPEAVTMKQGRKREPLTPVQPCHIKKQDRPTLPLLIDFPSSTSRGLNATEEIGVHYKEFGLLLLNDESGATITAIEHQHHHRAAAINCDILQRWIQGSGKQPVTWETLVKVLRQIKLNALADRIESSLS